MKQRGCSLFQSGVAGVPRSVIAQGVKIPPVLFTHNLSFSGALPHDPASPVRAYKKA
jgi:hypothetical protein